MDLKPTVVLGMEEEAAVSSRMIMFCYVKTISLNNINVLLCIHPVEQPGTRRAPWVQYFCSTQESGSTNYEAYILEIFRKQLI